MKFKNNKIKIILICLISIFEYCLAKVDLPKVDSPKTKSISNRKTLQASIDPVLIGFYKSTLPHYIKRYTTLSQENYPRRDKNHQSYSKAAVSSDDVRCSKVGIDVIKEGGNAFDAAVATEFCLSVINVHSNGLGGGGLALGYIRNKKRFISYKFRERASSYFNMRKVFLNTRRGFASMGVPGQVYGLHSMWKEHGRLPWKRLIIPSILIAHKGFEFHPRLRECVITLQKRLFKNPFFRKMFWNGHHIKQEKSRIFNKQLATTLLMTSQQPLSMYKGKIKNEILKDMKKYPIFKNSDFENYSIEKRPVLRYKINKHKTYISDSYESGGPLVAFSLNGIKHATDLVSKNKMPRKWSSINKHEKSLYTHQLIQIFRHAFGIRSRLVRNPKSLYMTKSYWNNYRISKINPPNAPPVKDAFLGEPASENPTAPKDKGTSHISVVDIQGNAVSLTSSINSMFGSKIVSPTTGIIFNNQNGDFNRKDMSKYRLLNTEGNNPVAGKSPLSSMAPSMVVDNKGQVELVIGAEGGPLIVTSIVQVLANIYFFKLPLGRSIDQWRIHHQIIPNKVQYDSYHGIPWIIKQFLIKKGYKFIKIHSCRRSVVNAVQIQSGGGKYKNQFKKVLAKADARKYGGTAGL